MLRVELSMRFEMRDLGELHHFLGLEVDNVNDDTFVFQEGCAKKIIENLASKKARVDLT